LVGSKENTVVRLLFIGVVVTGVMAGAASAQAPRGADLEQVKARQKIFMMEGVLERAVQLGVDNLRRRVRNVVPDDALLQGSAPQVRGFRLDGYGVFFDVEVPSLRRSLAWSLRTMNQTGVALARDLAQMRAFVQAIADPRMRVEYDRLLQRIQRQMSPTTPPPDRLAAPAGQVTAQSVAASTPPAVSDPVPAPQADTALLNDPSDAYTEEVKAAVIEAMIENSGPLVLGADEWLTVAARDNQPSDPFMPGDQMTLVLRVKGSDLNAFRAGRLTLPEVRSRVEVGEF
jgi:hypothetical protein